MVAWIYPTGYVEHGVLGYGRILDKGTKILLFLHNETDPDWNDRSVVWYLDGSSLVGITSPAESIQLNTWYFVAGTYDGTTMRIYINGKEAASGTGLSGNVDSHSANPLKIGNNAAGDRTFAGNIDEPAVFNRTLSATEIQDIYLRGATRLNLSVRSCNDAACSGESFTDINDTSPQNLSNYSISDNRWFQYNVSFETINETVTPSLYNVTINHTSTTVASDTTKPLVNTTLPAVNSVYNITNVIEIAANATDETAISIVLANITYPNGTISQLTLSNKSGFDNKYNSSFTIPSLLGNYNITYIANDSSNNINSSTTSNFTVNVICGALTNSILMDRNVTSSGDCFTINASNVALNCDGYSITYATGGSGGEGVTSTGFNNVTVKNCFIKGGNIGGAADAGIRFMDGTVANFSNNTINSNGSSSASGIFVYNGTAVAIDNNTIATYGSGSGNTGIELGLNSTRVNATNNIISTTGTFYNHGLEIGEGSHSNRFINNQITTNDFGSKGFNNGIYLTKNSSNNLFENIHILTTGGRNSSAVYLTDTAYDNTFLNVNMTVTDVDTPELYDATDNTNSNYLVYNNSFGEIRWTDDSDWGFLEALGINVTNDAGFGLGRNLFIGNNTASLNISAFELGEGGVVPINTSANITLYNINVTTYTGILEVANFTTDITDVQRNGINCVDSGKCRNLSFTSSTRTLIFNTTSFSSFSGNMSAAAAANSRPTAPVPVLPANNSSSTNRTLGFTWNTSTDPDGDSISYELVIDDSATFNNPEVNVTSIAPGAGENITYAISTELAVDKMHYWKVRANDSTGYGNYSGVFNLTISSLLLISLTTDTVAFGAMANNETNNTTDNVPPPFAVENAGNIMANVTITGATYFNSTSLPDSSYQFKIRANESGSFDTANTTFINMTTSYTGYHVANFSWQDANDNFLCDILVTVPVDEPSGSKSSPLTFTIEG